MSQKLTLMRGGEPLPDEVVASEAQLTGSVRYLLDFVARTLKLDTPQLELIRPAFETLDLAINDKIEDWNQVFVHVLEELRQKGVALEQREALLRRMRRDGRTLLYRREMGEERLLTTVREEHRGNGFGIELVDHDRFKFYNDTYGHLIGDLVLSTTGRLFRMHRGGDVGVRWGATSTSGLCATWSPRRSSGWSRDATRSSSTRSPGKRWTSASKTSRPA